MTDTSEKKEPMQEKGRSRRALLTWFGQVAAGASLATFGIMTNVRLADAKPDCTPCEGCHITESCQYDAGCDVETGETRPYILQWTTLSGCVGRCTTIYHAACYTICPNPC